MTKLNQIIAIEKGTKQRVFRFLSDTYKTFQKPALFNGLARTYSKKDDDGEDYPDESKRVLFQTGALLQEISDQMTELFDVTATKDWSNCAARADIVVESARPRALAQLGVDVESLVERVPGLTWLSLTGHGRREPGAGWIAFGDDAGVAAGLATATAVEGSPPLFCGDAIADPLAGLHAALAALAHWSAGGGYLLDIALTDVVAHVLAFGTAASPARVERSGSGFEVVVGPQRAPVSPPRARPVRRPARPLGADTARVLGELIPC